ncbi:MAG: hypothetical protein IKB36_00960 [Clostridia bacterium]|nr:hypothetical protein [Clostridia bacterium]
MSDKKKLDGNTPENENYRDEMDELVRIFKEELSKAQEEAEESDDFDVDNIEVEGYDPKTVSLDEKRRAIVDFDNNCECCGERPRGTKKNPDSIFCEECEAILEKYPYDWKGLVSVVVILAVLIFGVIKFAIDTPVFSYMKSGDKNLKENKLYSAVSNYDMAEDCIEEELRENYKKLYAKQIVAGYKANNMDMVTNAFSYFGNSDFLLFMLKDVSEIDEEMSLMQATTTMIQQHLEEYDVTEYDKIIAELDSLSGKRIYESNGYYLDETNVEFTPSGAEKGYIYDESWLNIYKYAAAQSNGKDESVTIEYLEKALGYTEYVDRVWTTVLASAYIGTEQYDKAEALLKNIKNSNDEGIDDNLILSMIYRYRDKNYQRAVDICVNGLNGLSRLEDGYDLVAQIGYTLSMQKTLNLIMLGKYTDAYESAEECCTYQMDSLETVNSQSRDMLAILALATKNTEAYDELKKEIEDSGEYGIPFSQDVTDYKAGKITLEEIVMSGRYDLL